MKLKTNTNLFLKRLTVLVFVLQAFFATGATAQNIVVPLFPFAGQEGISTHPNEFVFNIASGYELVSSAFPPASPVYWTTSPDTVKHIAPILLIKKYFYDNVTTDHYYSASEDLTITMISNTQFKMELSDRYLENESEYELVLKDFTPTRLVECRLL